MLAAILNGKRRGTGFAGKRLALNGLEGAEDVLTATIFERLGYLPESILAEFLSLLLGVEEPIGTLDKPLLFWPSWTLDGRRVEPDVVLYGSNRTLLIEAKRYDDIPQQHALQLARELLAGKESGDLGTNPVLLTIGGLQDYSEKETEALYQQIDKALGCSTIDYELSCRSWYQVYRALWAAIDNADKDVLPGLQRLLTDIAATYEWHGLRTQAPRWLGQLMPVSIQRTSFRNLDFQQATPTVRMNQGTLRSPLSRLSAPAISCAALPEQIWNFNP